MEVIFQCPHCDARICVAGESSGGRVICPVCEEIVLAPDPGIVVGMEIGGYRIISKLGDGGMGQVFEATQLATDRQVALKILPPALNVDENMVKRFMREAGMSAKLKHPNVVAALDAGQADGHYYLAMSYIDGEDLGCRLKRTKRLPEREALQIVEKVAAALEYAWKNFQMLHRDLKPSNIMISTEGKVKLMDMGIAKSMEDDLNLTQQGVAVGSPLYMSPDQASTPEDLDCRSDIYSLGATLYHLVCGRPPHEGENAVVLIRKHLAEVPASPRSLNSGLSIETEKLIQRMMARERDDRFTDWGELRKAVLAILLGSKQRTNKDPVAEMNPEDGKTIEIPKEHIEEGLQEECPKKSAGWIYAGVGIALVLFIILFVLARILMKS